MDLLSALTLAVALLALVLAERFGEPPRE